MKNEEALNYSAAIQFLYGLQMFGVNFGLETTRHLAAHAGNPHPSTMSLILIARRRL